MTAEVIPFKAPPTMQPKCCFCGKEIPKGALALANPEHSKWMCRGCIQEAHVRMGAAA